MSTRPALRASWGGSGGCTDSVCTHTDDADAVPIATGVSPAAKARLSNALAGTWAQKEWATDEGRQLQHWLVDNVLVHAKNTKYWGQEERWLSEFLAYASRVATEQGQPAPTGADALSNDATLERFIGNIARSDRGRTVARSARRYLSAKRQRAGLPSLNHNAVISMIVSGVERAQPSTPSQAADIPVEKMCALAGAIKPTDGWFSNMVATMAMTGYLTLMRLAELRGVRKDGLVFVTTDGTQLTLTQARRKPRGLVRGLLIHVAWRKAKQDTDCWVPLSCAGTIDRILTHADMLARMGHTGDKVFPSRTRTSRQDKPHAANRIGTRSFVHTLRKLFVHKKILAPREASLLRGHSLRVGGSNNCRRQGISEHTHRLMGGWSSLTSSVAYMAMTTAEQFKVTDTMGTLSRTTGLGTRPLACLALRGALPSIDAP